MPAIVAQQPSIHRLSTRRSSLSRAASSFAEDVEDIVDDALDELSAMIIEGPRRTFCCSCCFGGGSKEPAYAGDTDDAEEGAAPVTASDEGATHRAPTSPPAFGATESAPQLIISSTSASLIDASMCEDSVMSGDTEGEWAGVEGASPHALVQIAVHEAGPPPPPPSAFEASDPRWA